MANTILVKKGAGVPSPDSLQEAELALDVVDGALYSKLNDGQVYQLNDGADVDAGVEIGPEPTNPTQGMLWLNDADQTVYIWDEGKWLEFPAGGTGGVDPSDYYTKTESDGKYQPKGNYILDAPDDGNLHLRRNGAWEIYTPSSGGGGSYGMELVVQPAKAGDWTYNSYVRGAYRGNGNEFQDFVVPDGMFFLMSNLKNNSTQNLPVKDIVIDGIKPWASDSQALASGGGWLYPDESNVTLVPIRISKSMQLPWSVGEYNDYYIHGIFYKDDTTLRAKLKDEIKGQAGTLEVPDE